ncbi:MAG: 5-formyltetrahydrofolate cyclo-ligase [Leptolyngbyaceae cyanobacterium bins.349]|nr:5-formyltetrahydrofolate cyclo-ligase [Leptolyngbyaceae cyanobacterium bins.349]
MPQSEWSDRHPEKEQVRREVWARLQQHNATHRDPVGHIPDFAGAVQAAARLATLPIWQQAQVVKCNPDSPQKWVRSRALQDNKRLYMAVPRLTNQRCFVELTAAALQEQGIALEAAATMRNALVHGRLVSFEEMHPIDLVVVGCVAVTAAGGRTGKGAGFADLELAMLKQFQLINHTTPIVTTVHSLQQVDTSYLPMQAHDWALDWIITPDTVIQTNTTYSKPDGLDWDAIQPDQYQQIPILQQLKTKFIASNVSDR